MKRKNRKLIRYIKHIGTVLLIQAVTFFSLSGRGYAGDKTAEPGPVGNVRMRTGYEARGPVLPGICRQSAEEIRQICIAKKRKRHPEAPEGAMKFEKVEITEEIFETATALGGNTQRLREVMEKAEEGEEITLAYIGGSITRGANASDEDRCYAALATDWWEEKFPDTEINYINAGIGETDSYIGVHRVQQDVLDHDPDVVVVEFSVNDETQGNKETYESLLRRLLESESEPAVICLMMGTKDRSFADEHIPIALHYDLPVININGLMQNEVISWGEIGSPDGIHPSDAGHQMIGDLFWEYYENVLDDMEDGVDVEDYHEPERLSPCRYEHVRLVFADEMEAEGLVPLGEDDETYHGEGWRTEPGETVRIETEARSFGILYRQFSSEPEEGAAIYEIYVDGEHRATISSYEDGGRGRTKYTELLREEDASSHVIELRPQGDAGYFEITALAMDE